MARTFPDEFARRLAELSTLHLRPPSGYATDDVTGAPIIDFEPPLTAQEQTTFALLLNVARSPVELSPTEFQVVQERIDGPLLAFRNQSQAQFRQQFPTAEDQTLELRRRLIDVIAVLRAVFRSPG